MVHPTKTIFSELVIYAACDSSVILLNLHGISIDNRFYPFFVVHGSPKSFASVGLAQARPN